ncbi:macro domain-containing protein [uncultured Fusobacterium sp.]
MSLNKQKNVCIPILGSGVTRMDNVLLTQQELLDIIIGSY